MRCECCHIHMLYSVSLLGIPCFAKEIIKSKKEVKCYKFNKQFLNQIVRIVPSGCF